jgi:hypothetical protein
MLKIVIANLFNKIKKYAAAPKIQGSSGSWNMDDVIFYS